MINVKRPKSYPTRVAFLASGDRNRQQHGMAMTRAGSVSPTLDTNSKKVHNLIAQ